MIGHPGGLAVAPASSTRHDPFVRWLVLLVVVACSGSPAPAPAPTAPPPKPAPVSIVCERAVRCGVIGASQLGECEGPTDRLTLVWGALAGHKSPDAQCLAKLAGASCRESIASCMPGNEPPTPNVVPGGACTRSDECSAGFCTAPAGCSGTCIAKHPIGGTCGSDQLCTDDAFCWKGTCRKRAVAGDPCEGDWQWCSDGLFCTGYVAPIHDLHGRSPGQPGTCRAPLEVGESCVADGGDHCRTGLYCAWGDASPTCQMPLPAGAACRWLDACGDGLECTGLSLHGVAQGHDHFAVARAGTCMATLDASSPCDPSAFTTGCPLSMRCDPTTKSCQSRGHEGDPCESSWITKPHPSDEPLVNNGCFTGNYCDVATRTCKRQPRLGAACTPQTFGVEDEPCFLAMCDASSHRCMARCR